MYYADNSYFELVSPRRAWQVCSNGMGCEISSTTTDTIFLCFRLGAYYKEESIKFSLGSAMPPSVRVVRKKKSKANLAEARLRRG